MAALERFDHLTHLAREKSTQGRRALLRELSDMFLDTQKIQSNGVLSKFEALFCDLADQAEMEARVELSERFSSSDKIPRNLLLQLTRDAIEVAGPILSQSEALTETDLISIVEQQGQDHIRAIARRRQVPERVSDAIVQHGDDQTVASLVANDGATLSRNAFETITERAESITQLQKPLIRRKDTPADLLADLMLVVSNSLRDIITSRFENLENNVLEAALAASERRMKSRIRQEAEYAEAREFITKKKLRRALDLPLLIEMLRQNKPIYFCVGFAELTSIGFATVKRALSIDSIDPLALICKAADLDKAFFTTVAILRHRTGNNLMQDARELGDVYDGLSREDAQRALRFMKVRTELKS